MKNQIKNIIDFFTPQFIINLYVGIAQQRQIKANKRRNELYCIQRPYLKFNVKFKDIHKGERCFILCNGPSILKEDLSPLKNEICFSVSNFYKHPLYDTIQPLYHCIPGMYPPRSEEEIIIWLKEMNQMIEKVKPTLFLGTVQEPLISRSKVFDNKKVSYIALENNPLDFSSIDITETVPGIQSVPIMCLMVSLYMGFREIYLLGTDHDSLFTQEYHYFFDRKDLMIQDIYVNDNGTLNYHNLLQDFEIYLILWKQYLFLKQIAEERNTIIVNLAQGSKLDVFPRNTLNQVLKKG